MLEKKANAERRPSFVPLPFTTFGEIAALGLEAHVYCMACKSWGQIEAADPHGGAGRRRSITGTGSIVAASRPPILSARLTGIRRMTPIRIRRSDSMNT